MEARLLIAEILKADNAILAPATPLSEIAGWDSLKMVRLVMRIEETIQRELNESELERLCTVSDVAQLLRAR